MGLAVDFRFLLGILVGAAGFYFYTQRQRGQAGGK